MGRERQNRIELRFLDLVSSMKVDHLTIRQTGVDAYIIVAQHPTEEVDYVLAPTRRPDEPREFTDFGRAVKFASNISGLKIMHLDLFDDTKSNDA